MGRAVVISSFLSAAFIIFLILWPASRPEGQAIINLQKKPQYEAPVKVRNVTPEQTLPGPSFDDGILERLPGKELPPQPKKPPKPIKFASILVVQSGILKSGDHTITLADIDPLPLEQKCNYQNNVEWPCGRFARTEFRQFIRNRTIECNPIEGDQVEINTRCKLDNYDISAWLVLTGWATPKGDNFRNEFAEAKAKGRGKWRKTAP